ncbi:MAG: sterol desaturase family protein [Burkholderiaceae bacterium]|nr:sterol desaturase family protein [Burkholderiaceae bacterium]
MEGLARHESLIQTLALLLAYLAVVLWERLRPLLSYDADDRWRMTSNFGLLVINHAAPLFVVPVVTAFSSWAASMMNVGWLNAVHAPRWMMFAMAVVALDLTGWVVHRAMHKVGPLWQVHRVHHSDLRFDSSLGFRFHPVEPALMAAANAAVVMVLGLPLEAVFLSGVITTLHNFFGHANASPADNVERGLRTWLITPDLHRVHHSAHIADSMSNFGIVFSWWDRLAGTYRAPAAKAPSDFGLDDVRDPRRLSLVSLLIMPFRRLLP